jgi:hypothetical protein
MERKENKKRKCNRVLSKAEVVKLKEKVTDGTKSKDCTIYSRRNSSSLYSSLASKSTHNQAGSAVAIKNAQQL